MGRKSLGLTPEEMKARREAQRKLREYNKRLKKRQQDVTLLVDAIVTLSLTQSIEDIANDLVRDKRWNISFNPNVKPISGTAGERIKRKKN